MRLDYNRKRLADVGRALRTARAAAERERWPRERLERFQQQRLNELAAHARERSPFWRERLPAGPVTLSKLPVLTKAELMDRFDEAVTDRRLQRDELLEHAVAADRDELWLDEFRAMVTSGSSGSKGLFVYDRPAWVALVAQFFRYSDWVGAKPRVPRLRIALVAGAAPAHMTRRVTQTIDIGLHKVLALAPTTPLPHLVAALNEFRPQRLNAYPSIAVILADEQQAGRLRLDLEGISTSSELLLPEVRARVEAAFGVSVTDLYGTSEGLWGCDCAEHAGIHLYEDWCIVENVDDRLLVTNLYNRVQPLIRFEISDLVAFDPEPCPCGRTLRRIQAIDGRAEDVLDIGGVQVHPLTFDFLTGESAVREFQVVQRGPRLTLRLALRDPDVAPVLADLTAVRLRRLGVENPLVDVEVVDAIERPASGKLAMVVADRKEVVGSR
jgi:putative adenylate-forming enzyme